MPQWLLALGPTGNADSLMVRSTEPPWSHTPSARGDVFVLVTIQDFALCGKEFPGDDVLRAAVEVSGS